MLTISLWFSSFAVIAISFHLTKNWKDLKPGMFDRFLRGGFCAMAGLSFWAISAYSFWVMGFEIKIGTVENGKMEENWWLPPVTLLWTVLTYYTAKPKMSERTS